MAFLTGKCMMSLAKNKKNLSEKTSLEGLSTMIENHLRAYFEAHQDHLPPEGLYQRVLEEIERPLLTETLRAVEGNQVKAATILGIHRNTLRRKIKPFSQKPFPIAS
jgi:two-component system nitrogen regulation response regulator GlnG